MIASLKVSYVFTLLLTRTTETCHIYVMLSHFQSMHVRAVLPAAHGCQSTNRKVNNVQCCVTGSHSPGKLLEFYVRPRIFGMMNRFTLDLTL